MGLKIGKLAELAGCLPVTIRFYEKKGLLKKPDRTSGNYRLYETDDIERLRFILHCRQNGIKLEDIRKLLAIRDAGGGCRAAHGLIGSYIARVGQEIEALVKLRSELENLLEKGSAEEGGDCSILTALANADDCRFCSRLREHSRNEA